jgi:hypothetical protein
VTDPALLKVSGVLDLNGSCGSGAAGYTDAVNLTGGASLDICDPSWGSDFTHSSQKATARSRSPIVT